MGWSQIDPDVPYNDEIGEPNTKAFFIIACDNTECKQHPSVYRDSQSEARLAWNEFNTPTPADGDKEE